MISCKNFKLLCDDERHAVDMHSVGLWTEELIIPSPTPQHETESVDGFNGVFYFSTTIKERPIKAVLQYEIESKESLLSFNRKIFNWFSPFREYYLIADEDPTVRYPVRVSSGYEIDELSWEDGKFNVDFIMFKPLSESVNIVSRKHTTNSFTYRNEGTRPINMRTQSETEILFAGASANLQIKNVTTADTWSYNGTTLSTDVIKLKGVQSFKNDVSIFKNTNKKLISFAVGNNEFEIVGTTGEFELSIRTRYYFL